MAEQKIRCPMCGKESTPQELYIGKSDIYKYYGKIVYCKSCIEEIYSKYLKETGNNQKAIYLMCRKLDIPYKKSAYDGAVNDSRSGESDLYKTYIQKLNSFGKNNNYGKNFDDSDALSEEEVKSNDTETTNLYDDFEITPKIIRFWGKGYEKEDYCFLEDTYKEWSTRYKCDTLAEEKTYKLLSLKELEIMTTRSKKENVDKLEETFRKLMSDANVTPRDANAISDAENMNTLGMWIKDIEKYRPAEYFADKKIYADFDSIREYLERFVFRPLKNLLTGTRDFDKEFNVENISKEEETISGDEDAES